MRHKVAPCAGPRAELSFGSSLTSAASLVTGFPPSSTTPCPPGLEVAGVRPQEYALDDAEILLAATYVQTLDSRTLSAPYTYEAQKKQISICVYVFMMLSTILLPLLCMRIGNYQSAMRRAMKAFNDVLEPKGLGAKLLTTSFHQAHYHGWLFFNQALT
jgi:hypothetical protein